MTLEPGSREVQSFFKQPRPEKNPRRSMRRKALNKRTRPVVKWSTDAEYDLAREIVERRSGGVCEHCGTERAENVHHKARPRVRRLPPPDAPGPPVRAGQHVRVPPARPLRLRRYRWSDRVAAPLGLHR